MWPALFLISNHSHIRQLQFATQAFSQKVLQQAVQISICQWKFLRKGNPPCFSPHFFGESPISRYIIELSDGSLNSFPLNCICCLYIYSFDIYSKVFQCFQFRKVKFSYQVFQKLCKCSCSSFLNGVF